MRRNPKEDGFPWLLLGVGSVVGAGLFLMTRSPRARATTAAPPQNPHQTPPTPRPVAPAAASSALPAATAALLVRDGTDGDEARRVFYFQALASALSGAAGAQLGAAGELQGLAVDGVWTAATERAYEVVGQLLELLARDGDPAIEDSAVWRATELGVRLERQAGQTLTLGQLPQPLPRAVYDRVTATAMANDPNAWPLPARIA